MQRERWTDSLSVRSLIVFSREQTSSVFVRATKTRSMKYFSSSAQDVSRGRADGLRLFSSIENEQFSLMSFGSAHRNIGESERSRLSHQVQIKGAIGSVFQVTRLLFDRQLSEAFLAS